MSEQELKEWFFEKLTNCYYVIYDRYPDNVCYYYDEKFIRKVKLSKINGDEIEQPLKPAGKCLFDQDLTSMCLWCDYEEVWSFLLKNSNEDEVKIKKMIEMWLKDDFTLQNYKASVNSIRIKNRIKNSNSLKSYNIEIMNSYGM